MRDTDGPVTEAGRRLLELLRLADAGPLADTLAADWQGRIALVEAEAALLARRAPGDRATLEAENAQLRELLALRPSGHTGPLDDRIPWFIHCGISHGADRPDCIVCRALAADSRPEQPAPLDVERLAAVLRHLGYGYGWYGWGGRNPKGSVEEYAAAIVREYGAVRPEEPQ